MSYSFAALSAEYEVDLARMVVTREREINETAERLLKNLDRYQQVTAQDGVPVVFIASSFEREASSNFRDNPAQGDPLDRVSRDVPRGMGPYSGPDAWVHAAIDAYRLDHLDRVGAGNWNWPRFCYEGEAFNGFGPRMHGRKTGYLWSGTNIYSGGKYVSDGVWSSHADDEQLGIVPVAKRMVALNPSLDLGSAVGSIMVMTAQASPIVTPNTASVAQLQAALNKFGADLDVDGSDGAKTRRAIRAFQRSHGLDVDGVAGIDTWKALNACIAASPETKTGVIAAVNDQPENKGPTFAEAVAAFVDDVKAKNNG